MNVLFPAKKFDVLYFYAQAARSRQLQAFLKGKEIAAKIAIPSRIGFFIRRGSKDEPLFIQELASPELDDKFFSLRSETRREEAVTSGRLSKLQEKVWLYFPPSKCIDFFYACNGEGQGRKIDRIFIDIDRTNLEPEKAQQVAKELVSMIRSDKKLNDMISYKFAILWTGSSFHVYLLLGKPQPLRFYTEHFAYSKSDPEATFIGRWVQQIRKKTGINVSGGHEKLENTIVIDPSQTPSGKLARVPFSLHFRKPAQEKEKSVDGVCVPVSEKMLDDSQLVKKLKAMDSDYVLKNLEKLSENLTGG
jgi:hypothetical protein